MAGGAPRPLAAGGTARPPAALGDWELFYQFLTGLEDHARLDAPSCGHSGPRPTARTRRYALSQRRSPMAAGR